MWLYHRGPDAQRQVIRRQRRKDMPAEPRSIDALSIPQELRNFRDQDFLIADVDMDDGGKLLIFSMVENVARLHAVPYWQGDGTFKSALELFQQLYT